MPSPHRQLTLAMQSSTQVQRWAHSINFVSSLFFRISNAHLTTHTLHLLGLPIGSHSLTSRRSFRDKLSVERSLRGALLRDLCS